MCPNFEERSFCEQGSQMDLLAAGCQGQKPLGSRSQYSGHFGLKGVHEMAAQAGPYADHPSYVVYHGSSRMVSHQTGVSTQPQAQWMQAPTPIPNCPPGLENLTLIDQILVHQVTELIEALVGYETKIKYEVKNGLGQRVYYAVEDSEINNRMCCGGCNSRFIIKILDDLGQTVMHLVHPLGCGSYCIHQMEVQAPPGKAIGYIVLEWHPFIPKMSILNESHETVLKIRGSCFAMSRPGDVNFEVVSRDEATVVGKISKQWSGLVREYLTDTDNFGIQFPMDLDVKIKAVLLGTIIFVFQNNKKRKRARSKSLGTLHGILIFDVFFHQYQLPYLMKTILGSSGFYVLPTKSWSSTW
ncbi:phospholipid scramblase 2-like [Hypanus sabinus]|uniref:phospholipid scramblase 2-like n=1 Tax=Hypanus sabinus TaxID=79690 RepID=UPI0028C5016B|nr:phospholipid scramblase 2-like [Hypanus sabinus]